eukprot:gene11123-14927_t
MSSYGIPEELTYESLSRLYPSVKSEYRKNPVNGSSFTSGDIQMKINKMPRSFLNPATLCLNFRVKYTITIGGTAPGVGNVGDVIKNATNTANTTEIVYRSYSVPIIGILNTHKLIPLFCDEIELDYTLNNSANFIVTTLPAATTSVSAFQLEDIEIVGDVLTLEETGFNELLKMYPNGMSIKSESYLYGSSSLPAQAKGSYDITYSHGLNSLKKIYMVDISCKSMGTIIWWCKSEFTKLAINDRNNMVKCSLPATGSKFTSEYIAYTGTKPTTLAGLISATNSNKYYCSLDLELINQLKNTLYSGISTKGSSNLMRLITVAETLANQTFAIVGKKGSGKTSLLISWLQTPHKLKRVFYEIFVWMPKTSRASIKDSIYEKLPEDQLFEGVSFENLKLVYDRLKVNSEKGEYDKIFDEWLEINDKEFKDILKLVGNTIKNVANEIQKKTAEYAPVASYSLGQPQIGALIGASAMKLNNFANNAHNAMLGITIYNKSINSIKSLSDGDIGFTGATGSTGSTGATGSTGSTGAQ